MKLPQHPALPLLSLAVVAYLCGDVACAVMERQFSNRPQRQQTTTTTTVTSSTLANPGELVALLSTHKVNESVDPSKPPVQLNGQPPPTGTAANATVPLPTLVGTLEGQGQSLAVLQTPGNPDTAVVSVGEEYNGFKIIEVGAFQARLRDKRNQEYTISMQVAADTAPAPPQSFVIVPPTGSNVTQPPEVAKGPYKTSRELREDIDNKGQWIKNILVQPVMRNGESVGVQINYKGGENPFSRLGIQSGDVVMALNNKPAKGVDNLPDILMELRNAQSLNFNLERSGQPQPLSVNLEP